MAKVVITKLKGKTASELTGKRNSVGQKKVRSPEGDLKTLRTLDAGSGTFDADLTYVFGLNVAKARRENKRVAGVADVAPAKR